MKILINLFITFFKTGLFTFGGGYAMLPILKDEVVAKHHFATEDELLNYFSIGQCTPGIIAVNVATFCGYKLKKVVGAIVATLALVLPSLIIITLVASVLSHFMENDDVVHAMRGIRVGVAAVLIKIVYDLGKRVLAQSNFIGLDCCVFFVALLAVVLLKISSVFVISAVMLFSVGRLCFERRNR